MTWGPNHIYKLVALIANTKLRKCSELAVAQIAIRFAVHIHRKHLELSF